MNVIEMRTNKLGVTARNIGGSCLVGCTAWEANNLLPDTRYACCMIPIPEGYRLATEEDKKHGNPKPEGFLYMDEQTRFGEWSEPHRKVTSPTWFTRSIYAVPIKTEKDTKIEALQARLKDAEAEVAKVRSELGAV